MSEIIFNYIMGATAIAGFSVIWRNWVEDHPHWLIVIKKVLGRAHKVLTCGPCFTYWLALAYTIIVTPLLSWTPVNFLIGNVFLQWMALAWLAVFLRFAYIALQQYVRVKLD